MKKVVKALLLSLVTMGMATGCALNVPGVTPVNPPSGGDSGNTPSGGGDTPSGGNTPGGGSEGGDTTGGDSEGGDTPGGGDSGEGQEKTLTGISLNESALKKQYIIGETLDLTGLEVIARYSDNSTNLVTDYTTDPVAGTVLDVLGDKNVTVTYQNEVAQFTVNVVPVPKAAWTDDEKALMEQYLYGTVLPFVGDYDTEVYYDEKYDEVIFEGGYITTAGLAAYADVLENAGWTVLDISDDYDLAPGTIYQGLIGVETEAGTRCVQVYFYELSNELNMDAGDPYEYSFPTDLFKELGEYLYTTTEVPPAFDADYYSINSIEDSFIYYMYCYVDYEGELDDAGYSEALTAAGWTVLEEPDIDGYYVAVAPDQSYQIAYLYDFDYGDLDIYIEPIDFFPAERVNDFVCLYNGVATAPFTVPALDVEDGIYFFYEDSYNAYYAMFGYDEEINASLEIYNATGADIDTYITKLGKAGWEVEETDVYDEDTEEYLYTFYNATLTLADGFAFIQFMYDVEYEAILLNVFACLQPFPITEWPADYVVDTLDYLAEEYNYPEVKQDVLPALSGTDYIYETNGNTIYVDSETDTAEALLVKYVTILTEAHYTELGLDEYGDMNYLSPNGEIQVSPYIDKDGYFGIWFTIYVAPASEWPAEEVAEALADYNSTVPAFTGTNSGFRFLDDDYGYAVQVLVDDEEAAIASYVETLLGAGYVARGTDSYGDTRYISNGGNGDLCITVYVGTTGSITIAFADAPLFTFPAAAIASELGTSVTDTLPAIAGEEFAFVSNNHNLKVIGATVAQYVAILEEAEYTELGADSDGDMHYLSPNGQIEVCPFESSDGNLVIWYKRYVAETTSWSAEAVAAMLGENVTDVLPALAGGATYLADNMRVKITGENLDDLLEAYCDLLIESGFTFQGEDYYGDPYYLSPNGQFNVNPWIGSSGLYLDINLTEQWPAEAVAGALGEEITDVIPAYNGGYGYFIVTEGLDFNGFQIQIPVFDEEAALEAYLAILDANENYSVVGQDAYDYDIYAPASGAFTLLPWDYYSYSEGSYLIIDVMFDSEGGDDPETPSIWNADEVTAMLGEEITDVLPELAGATSFTVNNDYEYVLVDAEDKNAALEAYIELLDESGFTFQGVDYYGDPYYLSPNCQFNVNPYIYNGKIVIQTNHVAQWPTANVANALGEEITDVIPAYVGGYAYFVVTEGLDFNGFQIQIPVFDEEAALEAYLAILDANKNYSVVGQSYGYDVYAPASGAFAISPWDYYTQSAGSYLIIDVMFDYNPSAWPTDEIDDLLDHYEYDLVLPEYDGDYSTVDVDYFSGTIWVDITLSGDIDAEDALDSYRLDFVLANDEFERISYDEDLHKYVYSDGVVDVMMQAIVNGSGEKILSLEIKEHYEEPDASETFPIDAVKGFVPEAANMLYPTTANSYVADGFEGYASVVCNYDSDEAAQAALEAYIDALVKGGYTATDAGFTIVYIAPEGYGIVVYEVEEGEASFSFDVIDSEIVGYYIS